MIIQRRTIESTLGVPYVPFTVELTLGIRADQVTLEDAFRIGATDIHEDNNGNTVAKWPQFFWEWQAETGATDGMQANTRHQSRALSDFRLASFWSEWNA